MIDRAAPGGGGGATSAVEAGPWDVTRLQLFLAFGKIGLLGFGGVAAWARQIVVEEQGWLDELAYTELLGVSNILPGANTVNLAAVLGDRFCGIGGALAALSGLIGLPLVVLIAVAFVSDGLAGNALFQAALAGAGAGAAGLVIGNAVRLVKSLRSDRLALVVAFVVFVAVGLGRVPLVPALLVAVPLSLGLFAIRRRRMA